MQDSFPLDRETRLYNRERLKQEAAIGIFNLMEQKDINRAALARTIGKPRSFVTKVLEGSHNFTLKTLADVYAALGRTVHLSLGDDFEEVRVPKDHEDWTCFASVTLQIPPTIYLSDEPVLCFRASSKNVFCGEISEVRLERTGAS